MTAPGKKNIWQTRKLEETLIQKSQERLRLATTNVMVVGKDGLVGRSAEVTETFGRRRVDVVALQEVRYRNEGGKALIRVDFEKRLYWKGEDKGNGDIGLMVKCEPAKSVKDFRRISPRILSVDVIIFVYFCIRRW